MRGVPQMMFRFVVALVGPALLAAPGARGLRFPSAPACPVFRPDNPWNQRVDALPVARDSARIIDSIGAGAGVHADFGSGLWDGGPIGIPISVVDSSQATSSVSFQYDDESDPGPYPSPNDV